jgi:hypothetical protein
MLPFRSNLTALRLVQHGGNEDTHLPRTLESQNVRILLKERQTQTCIAKQERYEIRPSSSPKISRIYRIPYVMDAAQFLAIVPHVDPKVRVIKTFRVISRIVD